MIDRAVVLSLAIGAATSGAVWSAVAFAPAQPVWLGG
jgi:hypothetical protein